MGRRQNQGRPPGLARAPRGGVLAATHSATDGRLFSWSRGLEVQVQGVCRAGSSGGLCPWRVGPSPCALTWPSLCVGLCPRLLLSQGQLDESPPLGPHFDSVQSHSGVLGSGSHGRTGADTVWTIRLLSRPPPLLLKSQGPCLPPPGCASFPRASSGGPSPPFPAASVLPERGVGGGVREGTASPGGLM